MTTLKWRRQGQLFISAILVSLTLSPTSWASQREGGYAGLEFLGSSLVSRIELDKELHLHAGASRENADKAIEKLKAALEKKMVHTNIDVVPDGADYYVTVDVIETGLGTKENRHLQDPHHIALPNERPFALLEELKTRLQKIADEGKPATETYKNGVKVFSDFPATRTAELLSQQLEGEKPYLYKVLASDPNNERRAAAAEMLNWTPDAALNCRALIPALDDSDLHVRMAAAKYIWARINLLPDDFPFDSLLEGLSRQLSRPSHHDRIRAMAALMTLAKRDSDSISGIKTFDQAKLQEIGSNSVIPSVQNLAKQLLAISANPPPIQQKRKHSPEESGSGF